MSGTMHMSAVTVMNTESDEILAAIDDMLDYDSDDDALDTMRYILDYNFSSSANKKKIHNTFSTS